MKIAVLALAFLSATAMPGLAADDNYIDDRSDAAALVRSLYNAVSRKEYGRAWDYFGDQKPAKTFDKFVKGYADTERVDVATGGISEEGAAGSTFYQVAVAIQATNKNGDESVFAGCYTARLANPQIQGETFAPLHLEKGTLKPASSDGPLIDAVPTSCEGGPPFAASDPVRDQIIAAFKATYGSRCETLEPDAEPGAADPELHVLKYHYSYDPNSDEREAQALPVLLRVGRLQLQRSLLPDRRHRRLPAAAVRRARTGHPLRGSRRADQAEVDDDHRLHGRPSSW